MKKLFTLLFIGTLLISCSKDEDTNSSTATFPLVTVADAKVAHDNSNYGIYKGVFVGSSGVIKINIKNDGLLNAAMIINGTMYNFTTTESVTENQDIVALTFTSGNKSFDFNCSANGDHILIDAINFPGQVEASINVMKEYSDSLISCYQGKYTGGDKGEFNLMISGETVHGLALSDLHSTVLYMEGIAKGATISGTMENGTFSGSVFTNNMSGVWQNTSQDSGAWTAKRTL